MAGESESEMTDCKVGLNEEKIQAALLFLSLEPVCMHQMVLFLCFQAFQFIKKNLN